MKHLLPTITLIFISFLFVNCGDDDSEQEQVMIEDINKLAEDPLFLEYLQKESDATKRIVDLRITNSLYQNLNNLTDLEKKELAESLGYVDFSSMETYITEKSQMAFQLNEKYQFQQQDEVILNEIILSSIKNTNLLFQIGNNSNINKYLQRGNQDDCFRLAVEREVQSNVCGLSNSYLMSQVEFLQSNLIGEPCDFLSPDQTHFFPCVVRKDSSYYIVSYESWIAIACCISGSVDCNTEKDWCDSYRCC